MITVCIAMAAMAITIMSGKVLVWWFTERHEPRVVFTNKQTYVISTIYDCPVYAQRDLEIRLAEAGAILRSQVVNCGSLECPFCFADITNKLNATKAKDHLNAVKAMAQSEVNHYRDGLRIYSPEDWITTKNVVSETEALGLKLKAIYQAVGAAKPVISWDSNVIGYNKAVCVSCHDYYVPGDINFCKPCAKTHTYRAMKKSGRLKGKTGWTPAMDDFME